MFDWSENVKKNFPLSLSDIALSYYHLISLQPIPRVFMALLFGTISLSYRLQISFLIVFLLSPSPSISLCHHGPLSPSVYLYLLMSPWPSLSVLLPLSFLYHHGPLSPSLNLYLLMSPWPSLSVPLSISFLCHHGPLSPSLYLYLYLLTLSTLSLTLSLLHSSLNNSCLLLICHTYHIIISYYILSSYHIIYYHHII